MKKTISILLIENNEENYRIIYDTLQNIPHQSYMLDWVSTYDEAISFMKRDLYDLYLVDYHIGPQTGLDILRNAQKIRLSGPVILLSGQGNWQLDQQAIELGAALYLVKDQLVPDQLDRAIRYSIRNIKHKNQLEKLNDQMEKTLYQQSQAIDDQVYKLRKAEKIAKVGYWELNLKDQHFEWSEGLFHIFRLKPSKEPISINTFLEYVHPEDRPSIMPLFHLKAENHPEEQLKSSLLQFEYRVKLASGDIKYLKSVEGIRNHNSSGKISAILGITQDITNRVKLLQKLEASLEKERNLNALKSRFVSIASHEFRTPLATILSSLSLAKRYEQPTHLPKRQKHLNRIHSNVKHLTNLLDDFLSLSKLEEGKMTLNPQNIHLSSFFQEICMEMQSQSRPYQEIIYQVENGEKKVFIDSKLLKNALINLISNAIKYSHDHSVIELVATISSNIIHISVKDQGIGIPDRDQEQIFQRFFRAKNVSDIKGTGLGLHIVKKYIELLKGEISFTSRENIGTTFSITLPYNPSPSI